jgi:Spy/CpxP family protein refolding chaperone
MRSVWLAVVSVGALALLASGGEAQMGMGPGAGPKGGHEGGEHKEGHHPGGMMMGGMGGMDDADCDGESCPMMQGHGGPSMHMRLGMIEHMADELGLSDAVRKSIRDAIFEARKQAITLGAELSQAELELHRLLEQDKPDADAATKQVEKIGQLRTELMKLHVRTMLKIEQQLTPDQRKKLRKHMR